MPFAVEDFQDLIRLLQARPEWRADLRRFVLTEELLALPEQVARLRSETDQRFQELAGQVAALAEAQRRTEEQVAALTEQVAMLSEAQKRTEEQIAGLIEAQNRTDKQIAVLIEAQNRTDEQIATLTQAIYALTGDVRVLKTDVGSLKGDLLEIRYRERAPAYLGRVVRRIHVLSTEELAGLLEDAVERGLLTEAEKDEAILTDLVVRGRHKETGAEVYLAVEVSWGVGPHDVERAVQRAAVLSKLGLPALPVVAGTSVTEQAAHLARVKRVWQVMDGRAVFPEFAAEPSA